MNEKAQEYLSPFPGMDPYLEAPDIWPDFHHALAVAISSMLNILLPAPYYARLQKRPELGLILGEEVDHRIMAGVSVLHYPPQKQSGSLLRESGVVMLDQPRTEATAGVELRIQTDPIQHHYVEILDAERGHKLVTLIEIVSPSNKHPGPDRRAYETKQYEVLSSEANLIELDLLRSGQRLLPYPELAVAVDSLAPDYLVLLNRSRLRQDYWMDYTLYPVRLPESLPCIPIPLAGADPDILLDLQIGMNRVYRAGPYRRAIDYTRLPDPLLSEADAAWAEERLRAVGLRQA